MPTIRGVFSTEAGAEAEEEADTRQKEPTTTQSRTTRPRQPNLPTNPKNNSIPQAARLPFFFDNWKQVTTNNWILRVVKEGYKLQFNPDPPPPRPFIKSSYSKKSSNIIRVLLTDYLNKGAIMVVDVLLTSMSPEFLKS